MSMGTEKQACCADIITEKCTNMKLFVMMCTLIIVCSQLLLGILIYSNLKRVVIARSYRILNAMEKIHDVQIDHEGNVYPRVSQEQEMNNN